MLRLRRHSLLVAAAIVSLTCVGCSGSTSSPSPSDLKNSGLVVPAPPSGSSSASAPVSVVGPSTGCLGRVEIDALPGHEVTWDVIVRDAGLKGITRFTSMAFHEDQASCAPTIANPRDRIRQTAGPTSYRPGGQGISYFAAPANEWTCGRSQFDIESDDGSGRALLVGLILNYGHDCAPPPSTCVDRHDALAGPASWVRTSTGSVETSFTVNPRLAGPIHLSLVSREVVIPGQILPQRFLKMLDGTFAPGQRVDHWTIPAAACLKAQVDIVTCESPTGDLTAGNYDEQDRRTVSWFVDPAACR